MKTVKLLPLVALLAACDDTVTRSPVAPRFQSPNMHVVAGTLVDNTPVLGEFIVCKAGTGSGTFSVARTPAGDGFGGGSSGIASLTLNAGQCEVVVTDEAGENGGSNVAVTEAIGGGGSVLQSVGGFFIGINGVSPLFQPGNGDQFFINSFHGIVLTFVNARVAGNEGCTPGYWKQSQHFGNWPVSLTTTFAQAGFTFGFTGTLLTGLGTGGGGIEALARHAAAAYLNSLSSGVDFSLSTADVIAIANGTGIYLGLTIEARKNLLQAANEGIGGCPLDRNEG